MKALIQLAPLLVLLLAAACSWIPGGPEVADLPSSDLVGTGQTVVLRGDALKAMQKGDAAYSAGDWPTAVRHYNRGLEAHGDHALAFHNRLALTYEAMGRREPAIKHYSRQIEIEDSVMGRVGRAINYAETGQCPLAVQDAQISLDMAQPVVDLDAGYHSDVPAHSTLAVCAAEDGETGTALEHIETAESIAIQHGYGSEELTYLASVRRALQNQ